MGNGVTHPGAGHPVGLGEGAHADQPGVVHVDREDGVRRHEVQVRLVEHEEAAGRQAVQQIAHGVAAEIGSRGVVRVGEVEDGRLRARGQVRQRGQVVPVAAVGYRFQPAAEAVDVIDEGRVATEGRGDGVARVHVHADDQSQQVVDPRAEGHVPDIHAVHRGQFGPQVVTFGVAIPRDASRGFAHGRRGPGRYAEGAFVGADAHAERFSLTTFDGFGTHEGGRGGQACHDVGIRGSGHQIGRGCVRPRLPYRRCTGPCGRRCCTGRGGKRLSGPPRNGRDLHPMPATERPAGRGRRRS